MSNRKGTLVLGLVFVVAVILGAVLTVAAVTWELKLDVLANLAVAAGTVGLAYFTWESVRSTKDVIAAEDRRHQVGLAPLVYLQKTYGASNSVGEAVRLKAVLNNLGYGFARDITIEVRGFWDVDRVSNGDGTYTMRDASVAKNYQYFYSVIAAPPLELSNLDGPIGNLPPGASFYTVESYSIVYYDMFGNRYETHSSNNYKKDASFVWIPPKHLMTKKNDALDGIVAPRPNAIGQTGRTCNP